MLFLGIACSGLGYVFWYAALEKIEASRVAALLYLEPLVTLASAAVLLGEKIQLVTVAGGVILLMGVILRASAGVPAGGDVRGRGMSGARAPSCPTVGQAH